MSESQSPFKDVTLSWNGEDHVIPARRVMGAIARLETEITLKELYEQSETGTIKMSQVAAAYASVLRYAGVAVTTDEVYADFFQNKDPEKSMIGSVQGLLMIMLPPPSVQKGGAVSDQVKKPPRRARRAEASASRKRTRQLVPGE